MAATGKILSDSVNVYRSKGGIPFGKLYKGAIVTYTHIDNQWARIDRIESFGSSNSGMNKDNYKNLFINKEEANITINLGSNVSATDNNQNTSGSTTDSSTGEENYLDDSFTYSYGSYYSDEEYVNNTLSGLRVSNLRGIMGMPHQFLPNTDPKLDGSSDVDSFGRVYAQKIVANMPLMFMTPGTPAFMSKFSESQKKSLLSAMFDSVKGSDFDYLTQETGGKYYSLKFAYTEYFNYVNAMLRSAAYYLGIENEKINGKALGSLNWFFSNADKSINEGSMFDNNGLSRFIGTYAGAIPFYVEAQNTVSESFDNGTTQSSLASSIDGLSDTARELNFLIGNVSGAVGAGSLYEKYISTDEIRENIQNTTDTINNILGKGNVLGNIVASAQNILAGGRMIFPEIWSESGFSRSYNVSLKLVSPSGDKLSIFLNILVPIYHLLAFVLPRNTTSQSYYSPFLVRAYYKGIFNVDMGIITSLELSKGQECEWTPDGLPTVAEISFTIKDLYDVLSMSKGGIDTVDKGILHNIAELDYIATSCGININEPEVGRTIKMATMIGLVDNVKDKFTMNMFADITQFFNSKIENIFTFTN